MLEPRPPDGEGLPAAAPAARPRVRTAWRPQPIPGSGYLTRIPTMAQPSAHCYFLLIHTYIYSQDRHIYQIYFI